MTGRSTVTGHDCPRLHSGAMDRRPVAELLADTDDRAAWNELVQRFGGLVWSVARSFRLDESAAADVTQAVWLRLLEHRDRIREPERLAGWLATTTRREALALIRREGRTRPVGVTDEEIGPGQAVQRRAGDGPVPVEDQVVDAIDEAERHRVLHAAFTELNEPCRQLLRLLTTEPPLEYATISEMIDRPIGSIGPTRARCLAKLRVLLEQQAARRERTGEDGGR